MITFLHYSRLHVFYIYTFSVRVFSSLRYTFSPAFLQIWVLLSKPTRSDSGKSWSLSFKTLICISPFQGLHLYSQGDIFLWNLQNPCVLTTTDEDNWMFPLLFPLCHCSPSVSECWHGHGKFWNLTMDT